MSKLNKRLLLLLMFSLILLPACSAKKVTAMKPHDMGRKMDVRYYPVDKPIIKYIANHTYPEVFTNNEERKAWPALGGDKGGKELKDTTTECDKDCIDISTVDYIMSHDPCIWPNKPYYGVVGVCWNATNRGLYYTNKTVHEIPFYSVVETWFGTYGLDTDSFCGPFSSTCKEGRKLYAWTKCRKAVEKNYPWQASSASLQESPNPRIMLYNKYYVAPPDAGLKSLSAKDKSFQYLQDLLSLQLTEKLDGSVIKKKSEIILGIHKKWFDIISRIEIINDDHDKYLDDLNEAFNKQLDEYRKILTDEEYEKLFNSTKEQSFDIKNFYTAKG